MAFVVGEVLTKFEAEVKQLFDAIDKNGKHIGYRLPTIREIATFMSFPITYQFEAGNESSKYRLVGNAVCSKLSSALAKAIMEKEGIKPPKKFIPLSDTMPSLDLTGAKIALKVAKDKRSDAKFAIHIPYIKIKGFRVELNNKASDFENGVIKWTCVLHQGSGKNALKCSPEECNIDAIISDIPEFEKFKKDVHKTFDSVNMSHSNLQSSYVCSCDTEHITPERALEMMKKIVDRYFPNGDAMVDNSDRMIAIPRNKVPVRIIVGLYACDYFVKCLK